MAEKIALVTGATGSIGSALAAGLAAAGMHVVIVARDRARGEAVRQQISGDVDLLLADLSSMEAVRQLAEAFKKQYGSLDLLVNNAAVYKNARVLTADGLETMFATNHLAPFLLTHLLIDRLRTSGSACVLNITAPSSSKLDFDDLQGEKQFNSLHAFGASKMANLLFTFAAARRFEPDGIALNAIHPGLVRSQLMQEASLPIRLLTGLMSGSAERAAKPITRIATAPEFSGKSGQFYHNGKAIKADAYAYDEQVQNRLWEISERLVGI